jgi:hypothetical protein
VAKQAGQRRLGRGDIQQCRQQVRRLPAMAGHHALDACKQIGQVRCGDTVVAMDLRQHHQPQPRPKQPPCTIVMAQQARMHHIRCSNRDSRIVIGAAIRLQQRCFDP